jgi:ABC-2 type transport system permease protein
MTMPIKRIVTVMKAEFRHIIRDPISLILALFMPMFLLFLSGYSLCFELKEMPVAVFDMDQSRESRNYIKVIDNTPFFYIKHYLTSYEQAKNLLTRGETRCAIIIPADFSRKIKKDIPANVQILVDGSEYTSAQYIINYLSAINAIHSKEIVASFIKRRGIVTDLEPIVLTTRFWYNQSLRGLTFIITGAFSLSIMGIVPMLSALAIVREKESGSIQQIFVSPIRSYEYIIGKMTPYVILLTLDFYVLIVIGLWWFELPMRGSTFVLAVATFFMTFATVAIGFLISTLTKSQLTALLIGIIFTLMPAFVFADAIAPIANSPKGWQFYSCLFPARFYTGICRALILKGSGIQSYWQDALALVSYCIAIFTLSAWRVKNKQI